MAAADDLAAARRRVAEAVSAAKASEDHGHLALIGVRWDEVVAARRDLKRLEQQVRQQPPAPPASPPSAANLPDPKVVAAEIVKRMRAAVWAETAPLHAEIAELRRELATARKNERQARAKLAAVSSVARPRRVA